MKYFSKEIIAEMEAEGSKSEEISLAKTIHDKAQALIKEIEHAFGDVTLGQGTGLNEAQGLDDYQDAAICKKLREKDEKENWANISYLDLNRCYSSLSFFNSEGMRFYLPAFLIADIVDAYDYGMAFCLTDLSEYSQTQFSDLNEVQRKVVKNFLIYMSEDEEYEFEMPNIIRAIHGYWAR